jgi:hypothetical protein
MRFDEFFATGVEEWVGRHKQCLVRQLCQPRECAIKISAAGEQFSARRRSGLGRQRVAIGASPQPIFQKKADDPAHYGGCDDVKPSTLILGHRHLSLPQSSSSSRFTAPASRALELEPAAALIELSRFETMPSRRYGGLSPQMPALLRRAEASAST